LLRGLVGLAGILLIYFAWPVAHGAWYAQQADGVVTLLRDGRRLDLADTVRAIDAFNQAVRANPDAMMRLSRSELLAGAATSFNWARGDGEREEWLRVAKADLNAGLGGAPARGIAWLRLALVHDALEGPSPQAVGPLLQSIATAPVVPRVWPVRLALILLNWEWFTDAERETVAAYVAMTWRASSDRRWFVNALRGDADELYLRSLLADVPTAQDELTMWIALVRR
jgi:hypothetical protein